MPLTPATGGTGSFGNAFVPMTLAKYNPRRLVVFSRDEMKQWEMAKLFGRDERGAFLHRRRARPRPARARMTKSISWSMRPRPSTCHAEYNPFECVKTNILGART